MSKIGFKDLAVVLAQRHGLSQDAADRFISQMLDVLNDGLRYEKLVKIKGLGTFKVQSVNARKSVDVNTGEPIEIAEREKISYIPDAGMRDLVNRPFASFETVVLNDEVDLSDLDEAQEDDNAGPMDSIDKPDEITRVDNSPIAVDTEESVEGLAPSDVWAEQVEKGLSPASVINPEDNSILEEDQVSMRSAASATPLLDFTDSVDTKAQMASLEPEARIQEKWANDRINAENKVLSSANKLLRDQVLQFKRLTNIFGIIAAVLLLLFIGASVYVFNQLKLRDNQIEYLLTQIHINNNVKQEVPVHTEKIGETPEQSATATNKVKETISQSASKKTLEKVTPSTMSAAGRKRGVPIQQTSSKTTARVRESSQTTQYEKDPRIRTGAYNIIGIDQIVVVRKGQTLKSISKNHLGPGMECYVEAVNGGVKELKEGQKIKIPKLKIKKK
ncbi:HU family DNA-binding protein [Prevotella sp. oral taxon 376]|uniref:HU family DNA-binding protein n=1 Tax=Prevotella sp. oral taxon 376 TaxID=712466 RepID=UPI001E602CFC|nr:HU family DNA-binding protein [Prevotella sp. oral taxon 376]